MCYTCETKIITHVLHMEKYFSILCVTHDKLFGRLDALHMYTAIMSI